MTLFRFLSAHGRGSTRTMIILIVLSGLSSGLLLGVVNAAAEMAAARTVHLSLVLLFAAALSFFIITKKQALSRAAQAAEAAVRDIRIDLSDKIRRSELLFIEKTGRAEIYARLTQDTSTISQSILVIFNGYQATVTICAGLLYLLIISLNAFILTTLFLALGVWGFRLQSRRMMVDLMAATAKETEFFDGLDHLVGGFKENKLNHRKNNGVFARVVDISSQTEKLMSRTALRYIDYLVMSQALIYLMLAILVFVLPALEFSDPATILKLTATILFMVGPLEVVTYASHVQAKSSVALAAIERLETALNAAVDEAAIFAPDPQRWADFSQISLREALFRYPGADSAFQVGPMNVSFARGTISFVVGGNGCGKSTVMKLLTGLYQPLSGAIAVDKVDVRPTELAAYRELFSCIFADFHLFDRLYGLDGVDPARVRALLAEMQLTGMTDFVDGRFTNLDLSTGQRKRLAMIATLLEEKPILVFDEWAADQDPEFRLHFYDVLLPRLKAEGRTVIAVTHDDRYFDRCDQLIRLEYGEVVTLDAKPQSPPRRGRRRARDTPPADNQPS